VIFKFTYSNHRNGAETEISVPGKFVVCPTCNGTGTELCEGLRGVAFSPEQMDEDPDFRENYFGGRYDVACTECKGKRVVAAPDEDRMTKRERKLWTVTENAKFEYERELAYERQLRERGVQW
jgi:hypothetical protein